MTMPTCPTPFDDTCSCDGEYIWGSWSPKCDRADKQTELQRIVESQIKSYLMKTMPIASIPTEPEVLRESLRKELERVQGNLDYATSENSKLYARVAELEKDRDAARAMIDDLEVICFDCVLKIKVLETQSADLRGEVVGYEFVFNAAHQEIARLTRELTAAQADARVARADLAHMKSTGLSSTERQRLQALVDSKDIELTKFQVRTAEDRELADAVLRDARVVAALIRDLSEAYALLNEHLDNQT